MNRYAVATYDLETGIPQYYEIDFLAESPLDLQVFLETFGIPYDDIFLFVADYDPDEKDQFDPLNN